MFQEDYQDIFVGLNDDITKNLFIRYYAMEEYFQIAPTEMQNQSEENNKMSIFMSYNKIIHESIYQLYIMNKLIYSKAKIATTLLDNGRDISKKKNAYWQQFLQKPEFTSINKAYLLLSEPKKSILKYAVLSLSNLLLKLGINMSKISVIPIQKMLTFECLNIPVMAIIFLQFLQYKLFTSKKYQQEIHKSMFLRQLPKITVVKLSKYKNNTQIQHLQTAQDIFFTKQSQKAEIKNIQYIQLYEEEDPLFNEYQRQTKYDHIMSFSLVKQFGIKAPFTFEILLLMRSLIFPMISEFKPDLIVYYESSYESDKIIMDEEVRGLMLCEMSEDTACNKMYVIKEIGDCKYQIPKLLMEKGKGEQISEQKMKLMNQMDQKRAKQLQKQKLAKPQIQDYIRKIKKVLVNDLCYISLALIQKTTFDTIEEASHQHFYQKHYLEGLKKEQQRIISLSEKKDEAFNRIMNNKLNGTKSMIEVLEYRTMHQQKQGIPVINLINQQPQFTEFNDIKNGVIQRLEVEGEEKLYKFHEDDQFYVKYFENHVLVFIIRQNHMTVLSKTNQSQKMKKQIDFPLEERNKNVEGSTLVASDRYLYRAFGKYKDSDKYNQSIQRFKIFPEIGKHWELIDEKSIPIKSDGREDQDMPLERKKYGYGIFDKKNQNIIFLGGYIDSDNEEKISKTIYIIKNDKQEPTSNQMEQKKSKIYSMGKTNKILFSGVNQPLNKMFLHPFIFGIPFTSAQPSPSFIINSNGKYINVNNSKKIFTTNFKLSSVIIYNGIVSQKKLHIDSKLGEMEMSQILVEAELLIKYIVMSNNQINIHDNVCCLQTSEEGTIVIKAYPNENKISISRGDYLQEINKQIETQEVNLKFI